MLAFAAGAMMYVVVEELIPEMSEGKHSNVGTVAFALGFVLMILAGTPPTTVLAGTSRLTTAPAATTAPSPTVTPCRIVAFAPIQTFFPIRMGAG